jgi:GGDEF domain-containing protein
MTSSESEKVASSSLESEAQLAASFDAPNMLSKKVWHQMVEFEVANARIFNEALSVIFLDVDNLKDTNDTFGHTEGDRVIDNLQESIKQIVHGNIRTLDPRAIDNDSRMPDFLSVSSSKRVGMLSAQIAGEQRMIKPGRIGGDEFGILCFTDSEGAETIVNRIRDAFRNKISEQLKSVGVDVSIGVSTLDSQMTSTDLLRLADERLYIDKMSHLPILSDEDTTMLKTMIEVLKKKNIQLRHIAKYAVLFANNPNILEVAPSHKD